MAPTCGTNVARGPHSRPGSQARNKSPRGEQKVRISRRGSRRFPHYFATSLPSASQRPSSRAHANSMANSAAKRIQQLSQALDAEAEIAPRKTPAERPRQQSRFATPIRISKPFSGRETRTSTAPLLRDAPWSLDLEGESVTFASTVD
jgi:hypothetical protein